VANSGECFRYVVTCGNRREPLHAYQRKLFQKGLGKARVAAARKLKIRLWIMLREEIDYHEFRRCGQMRRETGGPCAGMPELRYGAEQSPTD
jgi:hypothetical protein